MTEPDGRAIDLARYDQSWFDRGRSGLWVVLWDLAWLCLLRPCPQPF